MVKETRQERNARDVADIAIATHGNGVRLEGDVLVVENDVATRISKGQPSALAIMDWQRAVTYRLKPNLLNPKATVEEKGDGFVIKVACDIHRQIQCIEKTEAAYTERTTIQPANGPESASAAARPMEQGRVFYAPIVVGDRPTAERIAMLLRELIPPTNG